MRPAAIRWCDFKSVLKQPSRDFVAAIAPCWISASITVPRSLSRSSLLVSDLWQF